MNLVSFSRESLNMKSSVWSGRLSSKFSYILLLALIYVMLPQDTFAASGCPWSDYSNLDQITWVPERGVIHYKIRVYQTWGGNGNRDCGWGEDGYPLTLTQNTTQKHVISINIDDEGHNNGCTIDGRGLVYNFYTEDAPSAQGGNKEKTYYYDFEVPVTQADLGKSVTVDLKGYWWKRGITGEGKDEEYDIPSFRQFTLNIPDNPGLQITNVHYDCAQTAAGEDLPVLYFDWKRTNNSTWVANQGVVFLCEGNSHEPTANEGVTGCYADTPSSLYVKVTNKDGNHNANKYYTYKLRQEIGLQIENINGISSDILYAYESDLMVVNAYSQVSDINVIEDSAGIFLTWKIPSAPTSNYDDSPFVITMGKTINGEKTEEEIEVAYQPDVTDYRYQIPASVGNIMYDFSIGRGTTKDLECFDMFNRRLSVEINYGKHVYPNSPKAIVSSDQSSVKIKWEKTGRIWTEGTQFKLVKTDLTTSESTEIDLTKEIFVEGSYVDSVEFCSAYRYKLVLIPGKDADEKSFEMEDVTTGGCPQVYLTLYDGANGKTDILIDQCNRFKIGFEPEKGWSIESVSYNGEDVTEQLQEDDYYETPEVTANSTLSVVYKKSSSTDVSMPVNSLTRVWTNDRKVIIGNAQTDTEVTVYDMMGRLVYSGKVDSEQMMIDTLGTGIFIVKVGNETFKVSL